MVAKQFEVEFSKDGSLFDEAQSSKVLDSLQDLTDLVVISHGWNNDKSEAAKLYDAFVRSVDEVLSGGSVAQAAKRRYGVVRVFWPSKRFADRDLIPGGGVASAAPANESALQRLLDELAIAPEFLGGKDLAPTRAAHLKRAKDLVSQLHEPAAQQGFVESIRAILDPSQKHADDGSTEFFSTPAERLFSSLGAPVNFQVAAGGGGATGLGNGGAAGFFGDLLDGVTAAARRIVNFATYYEMKTRAGTVGRGGLAQLLAAVRKRAPTLPIHLVGHSFGGRLVTAAASAFAPNSPAVTLTLLQAAFSHNGFGAKFDSEHDGAFRAVLSERRISGPVLITHTKNDKAVGVAYPLASRIARDAAAALGDANDPYGGMGRNGAQKTPEADGLAGALREVGGKYKFERGKVYNLRADQFIKDHMDVTGHQVAYALLQGATAVAE